MIDREKVIKGLECHINPNSGCKDCPYPFDTECFGFLLSHALELLKAQPRWIPVKEKLPEKRGFYLVANPAPHGMKSFVYIALYVTDLQELDRYHFEGEHRPGWCVYSGDAGYLEQDGITHWMPLPEPPWRENQNAND